MNGILASAVVVMLAVLPAVGDPGEGSRGRQLTEPGSHYAMAASADGRLIAMGGSTFVEVGGWTVWDLARARRVRTGTSRGTHALAFSPDGKLLAVGANAGGLKVFNLGDGSLFWDLTGKGHRGNVVTRVQFTPDGRYLLSAGTDDVIRVWDLAGKTQDRIMRFSGEMPLGEVAPPGTEGARWDVTVPGEIAEVFNLKVAPDGKLLAVCGGRPEVKLIDLETGPSVSACGPTATRAWPAAFPPTARCWRSAGRTSTPPSRCGS